MVFRTLIPASFCQITLLLLVFKVRSFLEHNPDHCTVDIYTRRLKYRSRVKENMSNMGNCGAGKSNKDDAYQCGAGKSNKDDADQGGAESRQTIKDFGYEFVKEKRSKEEHGEDHTVLRHIETGLPFEFDVYNGDRYMNQQRYEALGEVITEYVYKYLEEELKLKRVTIPVNAHEDDPKGFFFMSEDALESEKLMILIHGSGVVRAGQWARSLIINASFESGTMVPYIEQAKQEGYSVLITNGNHNYDESYRRIKGSENSQDHFVYVWNKFLKGDKCKAKHIVIVAHSFGGVVTLHALRNVEEAVDRIKAVAFTDSVHSVSFRESSKIKKLFKNKARNWASSSAPLDTPLAYYESDCEVVSAGTTEHVWTSHCAKDSVFKYFKEKLEEKEPKGKGKGHQGDENEPKTESTQSGDKNKDSSSVTKITSNRGNKKDIIAGKNKDAHEKGAELGLKTETNDAVEEGSKKVTGEPDQENVDADTSATTENKELKNQFDGPANFDGQEQGVGNKVVTEQRKEENKDTLIPEKTKDSEKQTHKEEKELKPTDEELKLKSNKQDVLKSQAQGEETSQGGKTNEDQATAEQDLKNVSEQGQQKETNTAGTPEGSDVEMKDEEER